LHTAGQNNPTGLDLKEPSDSVPMHPYATSKDAVGLFAFLILFAWFVFFVPDYLGHADNYIEANPLVTPPHIVPEWYFLPFYAILRSFTSTFLWIIPLGQYAKLCGVVAMFSAVLIIAFVPWLDTSRVRSAKYRPIFKWFFWFFVFTCVALGYLGSRPAEGVYVMWAQIFTVCYFLFFLVAMPIIGLIETPKKLPRSITESVLGGSTAMPNGVAASPEKR
jgi:ubiquinol-cytochrome c reductase cytochrome b subunit